MLSQSLKPLDSAQLLFPLGSHLPLPVLPLPQDTEMKEEAEPRVKLKTGSERAQVACSPTDRSQRRESNLDEQTTKPLL